MQDSPVFLDKAGTVEKTCALIERAAGSGASLIAFPETWIPGYPVWLDCAPSAGLWEHPPAEHPIFRILFENSIVVPGPETSLIGEFVRKVGATVVLSAHEQFGGTLYNTQFTFGPSGAVEQIHRKVMPTYTERMIWGMGDGSTLGVYHSTQGVVGGLICWEHWMPALRIVMHEQRELVHVAQWPWVKEMNQLVCRQYAFEGGCFVLAAGAVLRRRDLPSLPLLDEIARRAGMALARRERDHCARRLVPGRSSDGAGDDRDR